ncbi:MAG: T9SS type A sorting domain-containing protein [Bacteroidia bacterium]|nr:T9SS type A sorting domain-containing protein [Bacteroidia bacterium]
MKLIGTLLLLFALLCPTTAVQAGGHVKGDKDKSSIQKTSSNDLYDFISINQILMWISNNGSTSYNPFTKASGLEWPQGSGKYAIFQDGLVWGGKVGGEIRIGGSTYRQGLQAGNINPDGSAANAADPIHRIFKVRKVTRTQYNLMAATDQARLKKDFEEWPDEFGAPYTDADNNGQYNVDFEAWLDGGAVDTPWFIGDEVLWFVSNDLDPSRTSNLYGSPPIGVEVHTLVWGYNQTGPLGNMVFAKYTVINKGTDDLEDAYFAQWSDPDLGDAADDFVGIDTNLVLGFCYNGLAVDGVYGVPPAAGYDFFQGPVVPGAPEDVAHYNFGLLQGWKNLGVSGFAYYINSDAVYQDPDLGTPAGGEQMYNYLQSRLYDGGPFIDPTTNLEVKVALAGDPITKTGWIDGIVNAPDDRRMMMVTGPFTLNKDNDIPNGKINRQEVVVARIVGRGSDRISSLQVLKYYDRYAQLAFDNNFDLPDAPPAPKVTVSIKPNTVMLSWGEQAGVKATEMHEDAGYVFEGYNVYQFPTRSSSLQDAKRLATYDVINNVATIFDEVVDEKTGAVVVLPVQFGGDTGIQRLITITNDAITDRPLVNNQPYYFAVTAYAYNDDPEAAPRQLESAPQVLEVYPQTVNPGYRFGADYDELMQVMHTRGSSTGYPVVKTIDPVLLTGDSYEVTFRSVGKVEVDFHGEELLELDSYAWTLKNVTKNTTLVADALEYGGVADGSSTGYLADGFQIGMVGQGHYEVGHELLEVRWEGGPQQYGSYADVYFIPGYDFFGSTIKSYDVKKTVEVRFDKTKPSKGYVFFRGSTPNYQCQGYHESPISIWDVTDKANPRQLSWTLVEQVNGPAQDFQFTPTAAQSDREYLFILDHPYSDTPNPTWTDPTFSLLNQAGEMPILYAWWPIKTATAGPGKFPWQDGDKLVWVPNIPFDQNDVYTFTTAAPKFTVEAAREDINDIQVFPNPYLGASALELNKYQRFVTINHLPERAKFRIYTVSGTLVRSFEKNDATQLATWDLQNDNGLPVASGMYLIHIDMPDLGVEKVLKLGVVTEAQYLDRI